MTVEQAEEIHLEGRSKTWRMAMSGALYVQLLIEHNICGLTT